MSTPTNSERSTWVSCMALRLAAKRVPSVLANSLRATGVLQLELVGLTIGFDVTHHEAVVAAGGWHARCTPQGRIKGGAGVTDVALPVGGGTGARASDALPAEEDGRA